MTKLHTAFGRMQPEKIYVQDRIRQAQDEIWALIDDGAIIYVCGDASRMEPDVRKTLIGILGEKLGIDDSAAGKRFEQLVAENRYRVDVWATG